MKNLTHSTLAKEGKTCELVFSSSSPLLKQRKSLENYFKLHDQASVQFAF